MSKQVLNRPLLESSTVWSVAICCFGDDQLSEAEREHYLASAIRTFFTGCISVEVRTGLRIYSESARSRGNQIAQLLGDFVEGFAR